MPGLLRPAARPARALRVGAHGRAGGPRLQRLSADPVPAPDPRSSSPTARAARCSSTTSSTTRSSRRSRPTPDCFTCRSGARTRRGSRRTSRSREGLRGPGRYLGCNVGIRPLPAKNFVWYGEGELKIFRDGDTTPPDDLRHRTRGLRRHGLGHGRALRALRRRAARGACAGRRGDPRLHELLPLARARSGRVRARPARDAAADRLRGRAEGRRGGVRELRAHESRRRRGLAAQQPRGRRARPGRARRRLLRDRVRVLPRRAARAAARARGRDRGHRAPPVRTGVADGADARSRCDGEGRVLPRSAPRPDRTARGSARARSGHDLGGAALRRAARRLRRGRDQGRAARRRGGAAPAAVPARPRPADLRPSTRP